jgi:glyoxylase-like metal-dependent hydrolase (beta-lactamase superfamily II)
MSGPSLGLGGKLPGSGWSGGVVSRWADCVLAPNAGPMTLDGTNTWVLHEPGSEEAVVLDPGPLHEGHLRRILSAVTSRGARVGEVLLTHGHLDHSEGAVAFARLSGADRVRALDPAQRLGSEGLGDGDVVPVGQGRLDVVATPGHTSDSLSFVLHGDPDVHAPLLTGDTVLGRGTSVVAYPDGQLGPYLDSLRRLRNLAESAGSTAVWPGHGPVLADALGVLDGYLAHREQRLDEVRAALAAGARTPHDVVERVYADVDRVLWPAAELSVRAQLEHLGRL